jgi:hypothetical protein
MPTRPHPYTLSKDACTLSAVALRHLRDAQTLLDTSPDGAFYLAGYGPEIARKVTLSERWSDRLIGHLNTSTDTATAALSLALDNDALGIRYAPYEPARFPMLSRWSTHVRYERGRTPEEARGILREARQYTDDLVATMWAEGRFPDGATPW